jgi:hypothetical protein
MLVVSGSTSNYRFMASVSRNGTRGLPSKKSA